MQVVEIETCDPNDLSPLGALACAAPTKLAVAGAVVTVSMAASAYHGFKRNDSVGWAVWWAFMGTFFPVFTPVVAVAQGYGKRRKR